MASEVLYDPPHSFLHALDSPAPASNAPEHVPTSGPLHLQWPLLRTLFLLLLPSFRLEVHLLQPEPPPVSPSSPPLLQLFLQIFSHPASFIFACFLGSHPQHMEVPRPGLELELQLPVYSTATATRDPSYIWDLLNSSQ